MGGIMTNDTTGWVDVNLTQRLEHGRYYLTRMRGDEGSAKEIYATCSISVDGDEVWFTTDKSNLSIRVDEVLIQTWN